MSRDWNIVDDESPIEVEPVEDETRLNLNRIDLIARERRSAHKVKQWRVGVASTLVLAAVAIAVRAVGSIAAREHVGFAMAGIAIAVGMTVVAIVMLSRPRSGL